MMGKTKITKIGVVALAVFSLALLLLDMMRDEMIIRFGIKACRAIIYVLAAAVFIVAAIVVINTFMGLLDGRREEKAWQDMMQEKRTADKAQPALAMKGRLDGPALAKILSGYGQGAWSCFHDSISRLLQQMSSMDSCQERLHKLLESNDADALANTEEIMDGVEQYMFRCIRKACNYMQAYSPSSPGGTEKVHGALEDAIKANTIQLGQAQEFLGLIADFLNEQGMDQSSLDMLEIYKKTILDSIQEPEDGLTPRKEQLWERN